MTVEENSAKPISFEETVALVMSKNYRVFKEVMLVDGFDINRADFRGVTTLHYAAELDDVELIEIIASHPKVNLNPTTWEIRSTPVMIAAGNGKTRALKALLEKGADTALVNAFGFNALMLAAQEGHLECVKILLKFNSALAKTQNEDLKNPLMLGIRNLQIAERLIPVSDLFSEDFEGNTVLHHACKSSSLEVVRLILEQPALNIDARNENFETPLHTALINKKLDVADLLIQNGAKLVSDTEEASSAYVYAARHDDTETFLEKYEIEESQLIGMLTALASHGRARTLKRLLSKFAAYYSTRRDFLDMAMVMAAREGHVECMKLLLADHVVKDHLLVQAVYLSILGKHFACFELAYSELLKLENADELVEENKESVLNMAFTSGNVQVCSYFLDQGICPNGDDESTYLMVACGDNNVELVKALVAHGADVNRPHSSYGSALILAATNNNREIVKILLENGADPLMPDSEGFIPLLSAAYYGCAETFFELFAAMDASVVNYRSKCGLTPLLAACSASNIKIIEALVQNGACLTDVDDQNSNCLHFAALNKDKGLDVLFYLFGKLQNNFTSMIFARDSNNTSPLETVLSHKNQRIILSLLAAKPELYSYLTTPLNYKIAENDCNTMCLICRDDFAVDDLATRLPCKHLFHEHCYSEWSLTKANCPYCQRFPFNIKQ